MCFHATHVIQVFYKKPLIKKLRIRQLTQPAAVPNQSFLTVRQKTYQKKRLKRAAWSNEHCLPTFLIIYKAKVFLNYGLSSSYVLILPDILYNGGFKEKLEETDTISWSQTLGKCTANTYDTSKLNTDSFIFLHFYQLQIAHQIFCEDKSAHYFVTLMGKINGASFRQYWHDRHDRISEKISNEMVAKAKVREIDMVPIRLYTLT